MTAFHYDDIPHDIILEKLSTLTATLDGALEEEVERLSWDPEVMAKRLDFFLAYGAERISPQ